VTLSSSETTLVFPPTLTTANLLFISSKSGPISLSGRLALFSPLWETGFFFGFNVCATRVFARRAISSTSVVTVMALSRTD